MLSLRFLWNALGMMFGFLGPKTKNPEVSDTNTTLEQNPENNLDDEISGSGDERQADPSLDAINARAKNLVEPEPAPEAAETEISSADTVETVAAGVARQTQSSVDAVTTENVLDDATQVAVTSPSETPEPDADTNVDETSEDTDSAEAPITSGSDVTPETAPITIDVVADVDPVLVATPITPSEPDPVVVSEPVPAPAPEPVSEPTPDPIPRPSG